MKKILHIFSLFLCCVFLAGCGRKEDTQQENVRQEDMQQGDVNQKDAQGKEAQQNNDLTEYTDILSDLRTFFRSENSVGKELGMQFYQGEAVQLQAFKNRDDTEETMDIYLCKKGGNNEILLKGISADYYYAHWFLDEEGNFYCWAWKGDLVKMDSSGKEVFRIPLADIETSSLEKICQLADGRILISYLEGEIGSHYTLSEVDSTGKVSKINTVKLEGVGDIAAGQEGLLYMDSRGVYEINMKNGIKTSILSFLGTSYMLPTAVAIEDFRVLPEGGVELLRHDSSFDGVSEVLQAGIVTTDKAVVTLRCYDFSSHASSGGSTEGWLKTQIKLFNRQNTSYMVVVDESLEGMEREDFARQTSIEMAAGKGPDILFGDVLGDYVYGAIQKGALVDLTPYMESTGVREEDYFPAAFDCWKENGGIYGICMEVSLVGYRIDQEVLGGHDNPDVETLVDALLAWPEDAVFMQEYDSQWVLEYLLQGSENIWGMVDWDTGNCDFSGKLFAKILETAKRYGDDERKNYPALAERRVTNVMSFDTAADREAEGKTAIGIPFEDGGHAVLINSFQGFRNEMLAVNANSAHVEGAWEFISFLLGEEVQMSFEGDDKYATNVRIPVNRKAFETCLEKRVTKFIERKEETYAWYRYNESIGELIGMYERSYEDLTEEKLAEFREFLEDARSIPVRTVPILDVIYEEAEYYFNGTKSIEEVSAIIRNRVQLYMDENN